jgi:hypothetical protein
MGKNLYDDAPPVGNLYDNAPQVSEDGFTSAPAEGTAKPSGRQSLPGKVIQAALEGTAGTAASLINMPRGLLIDPAAKSLRGLMAIPKGPEAVKKATDYTPAEMARLISGTGGLAGLLTGGAASRLEEPLVAALGNKAGMTATGALAGAAGAGADATVRTTAETGRPQIGPIAGATAFGGAAGGIAGRFLGRQDPELRANFPRAANPFSAPTDRIQALDTGAVPPATLGPTPFRAEPQGPMAPPSTQAAGPFAHLEMGPGRTIAHMLDEQATRAATIPARSIENLRTAGLDKLDPSDRMALGRLLDGQKVEPAAIKDVAAVKKAFDAVRQETAPIIPAMRAAGGKVGSIEQYYPRVPMPTDALAKGLPRQQMIEALPHRIPGGVTPEEAKALVDDYREFTDSGGTRGGQLIVNAMNKVIEAGKSAKATASQARAATQMGTFASELEAERAASHEMYGSPAAPPTVPKAGEVTTPAGGISLKQLQQSLSHSTNPKSSNLDYSRTPLGSLFYDPDPVRAIPQYLTSAHDRLSAAQVFGPNNEHVNAEFDKIPHPAANRLARQQFLAARGAAEVPDAGLAPLASTLRAGGSHLMTPLSSVRNLTQGANTALVTSPGATARSYLNLPKSYAQGRGSGAVGEHALQGFVEQMGGEKGATGSYLKNIGMTGTENVNRAGSSGAAGGAGNYAQSMVDALKGKNAAFAQGELSRLHVRPEDIVDGKLTQHGLDRASYWATRRSQFVMSPADLPSMLTTSELGRTVGQFKPFSILQGKMLAKETLDRLRSPVPGDRARGLRNLAILATIYPALGEVSADTRAALRNAVPTAMGKRPVSKLFERAQKPTDAIDRLQQNASEMGGIGAASDFFQSLDFNPLEYVAGPSLSQGTRVLGDLNTLAKKGKLPNSEKRRLARLLPYVGWAAQDVLVPKKGQKGGGGSSQSAAQPSGEPNLYDNAPPVQ